jgi:hypothetical protein
MANLLIYFRLTLEGPLNKRKICTAEWLRVKMYKKLYEIMVATLLIVRPYKGRIS